MNRDRAVPGPGADTVLSRDRVAAGGTGVGADMSRDRPAGPGGDGVQTVVGPDNGDGLDGGVAGDKRLFSNPVTAGRDVQVPENHTDPPPTNPVLAQPQQVGDRELKVPPEFVCISCHHNFEEAE